jgi:hypothetical protein
MNRSSRTAWIVLMAIAVVSVVSLEIAGRSARKAGTSCSQRDA